MIIFSLVFTLCLLQTAAGLVFSFTRQYGNHLREGWRNVVDAILNLHAARLLHVPQVNPVILVVFF